MADHQQCDDKCAAALPRHRPVQQSERDAPGNAHDEAVRPRVIVKIEGSELRRAALNPHMLDSQDQEDRPDEIDEHRRCHEDTERRLWSDAFGRKGNCIVADEHCNYFSSVGAALAMTDCGS